MADDEKAKLYRRIVQQTPDAVLLERMRLHGFWPSGEGLPQPPPAETAELNKINAEISQIQKESSKPPNPQEALRRERKRRWEASKQRRAEAKARKQQEAAARRADWEAARQQDLVHAGEGVSHELAQKQGDPAKLEANRLPILHTAAELAAFLGISIGSLRWLTYHRRGATVVHYRRFELAKKTGGVRCISAPKPALAEAQRKILRGLLDRLSPEPQAHGFAAGRSILTNAAPHVGRKVVVNLDLKEFFPSITFRRVRGLFRALGYSGQVSTVLALLCTEPPRLAATVGGKAYWVSLGERVLPQGACTSPAITNALCRKLDRRLAGLARHYGFAYTRYADDLSFSGDQPWDSGRLLHMARGILEEEGFREHPRKTKVLRRAGRQEVTGLTVNEKPAVARAEVRELRAILHNAARWGLESQNREGRRDFAAYLRGRVEFIAMVDRGQGDRLRQDLARALEAPAPRWAGAYERALHAADEAARLLRAEFHARKEGSLPEFCRSVERKLQERLMSEAPGWGWRGRRTDEIQPRSRSEEPVWIVDALDGESAFEKGRRGSSVAIGLALEGVPVLGVVYAFNYPDDEGDLVAWAEGCGPLTRNREPVKKREAGFARTHQGPEAPGPPVLFLGEEAEERVTTAARLASAFVCLPSSAYRLALAALGEGECLVENPGWGLEAGRALLRGAGLELVEAGNGFGFVGEPGQRHRNWSSLKEGERPASRPFSRGKSVSDSRRLARAQGCWLGQLAGDSLGGLVEFQSEASIRARHPHGVRELIHGGTWNNLPGQPTDDSEMALMLARMLVRVGAYDPTEARRAYVHWYRSGPFDVGGTTSMALGGGSPSQTSQANGSLMRISPLGIFAAGHPERAAAWARQDSSISHPHPACLDACAAYTFALAVAIGDGVHALDCYQAALDEASRPGTSESVRQALEAARTEPPADYQRQMGWVLIALQNAFYQLLHAPSPEAGIVDTVMRGGDTDTNAAIAGALLGAVHGRESIPRRWRLALQSCRPISGLGVVHPRPPEFWPCDALELAEALLTAGR